MHRTTLRIMILAVLLCVALSMGAAFGESEEESYASRRGDFIEYSSDAVAAWLEAIDEGLEVVRTDGSEEILRYRFGERAPEQMLGSFSAYYPLTDEQDVDDVLFDSRASADRLVYEMLDFQRTALGKYTDFAPIDADKLQGYMRVWVDLKGFDFAMGSMAVGDTTYYWEPVYYDDEQGGLFDGAVYLYVCAISEGEDRDILEEMRVIDPKPAEYRMEQYLIADGASIAALLNAMDAEKPLGSGNDTGEYEPLELNSKGNAVRDIQIRLVDLGYLSGSVDGYYGPMTQSAVTAYQEAVGLPADGIADEATQRSLLGQADELSMLKDWLAGHS